MLEDFLFKSKDINKDSYIWNMLGSMLMAFQSVIMLMILTRIVGLIETGIFTIAYANANLFLTVGKYGMRNYQVSDVKHQFSFNEYKKSRIITTFFMILLALIYILYTGCQQNYSLEKSLIILIMCLFKTVDSIEDVFIAMYQQYGRLDVGSKIMTIRIAFTLLIFSFLLIITRDLMLSLSLATVFTLVLLYMLLKCSYPTFKCLEKVGRDKKVKKLLQVCFPLFIGTFLSFYIGNAPKYAIDLQLDDSLQACYGFIAMPVFVVGMLNNFIFNPILHKMALYWSEKKLKLFLKKAVTQVAIIAGITFACIVLANIAGIPILSLLYNTDLSEYKKELLILLLGGGFLGLSGFLSTLITIMRIQRVLIIGYGLTALLAFYLSPIFVSNYGINGAAIIYVLLMMLLCFIFIILILLKIIIERKQSEYG